MKLTTFQKGMIFAVFTVIGNTFISTGIPSTLIGYEVIGLSSAGALLIYLAKNKWLPSTSPLGFTSGWDILSGIFLAVGNFFTNAGATAVLKQTINWPDLIHGAITVGVLYFFSKFATGTAPASVVQSAAS